MPRMLEFLRKIGRREAPVHVRTETDGSARACDLGQMLDVGDRVGKRRAAAVKSALVSRYGVGGSRLSTDGHGESSPHATNTTPEGRARNRRVELRRI